MTQGLVALNLLLTLATFAAVGALFAWAAWRVARRFGEWSIAAAWAFATPVATALMVARVHLQHAAIGFTPADQRDAFVFASFLPMWAVALGGVALVVWRHRRGGGPDAPFTRRTAARSVGAFVAGVVLFFLVLAARDVAALVRGL